jgi:hypothetical protein
MAILSSNTKSKKINQLSAEHFGPAHGTLVFRGTVFGNHWTTALYISKWAIFLGKLVPRSLICGHAAFYSIHPCHTSDL